MLHAAGGLSFQSWGHCESPTFLEPWPGPDRSCLQMAEVMIYFISKKEKNGNSARCSSARSDSHHRQIGAFLRCLFSEIISRKTLIKSELGAGNTSVLLDMILVSFN